MARHPAHAPLPSGVTAFTGSAPPAAQARGQVAPLAWDRIHESRPTVADESQNERDHGSLLEKRERIQSYYRRTATGGLQPCKYQAMDVGNGQTVVILQRRSDFEIGCYSEDVC